MFKVPASRQRSQTVNSASHSAYKPTSSSTSAISYNNSPRRPRSRSTNDITNTKRINTSEALSLIEHTPVSPPDYSTLPPGQPRAVWPNDLEGKEKLPVYEPTVFKVICLSRKLEWLTPYELAPHRQWKNVVLELNSTQLNVYSNEHQISPPLYNRGISLSSGNLKLKDYGSRLTTENDIKQFIFYKERNIISPQNLIRSYSLQYGKAGIAIDYKKKKNTIRLRLETEQFLLEFATAESMIEWYCCLTLGIDNSLDLSRREMPKYRTVPRRRRRRNRNHADPLLIRPNKRHHSIENIFKIRNGSTNSSPDLRGGGFMSKLKRKLSSNRLNSVSMSTTPTNLSTQSSILNLTVLNENFNTMHLDSAHDTEEDEEDDMMLQMDNDDDDDEELEDPELTDEEIIEQPHTEAEEEEDNSSVDEDDDDDIDFARRRSTSTGATTIPESPSFIQFKARPTIPENEEVNDSPTEFEPEPELEREPEPVPEPQFDPEHIHSDSSVPETSSCSSSLHMQPQNNISATPSTTISTLASSSSEHIKPIQSAAPIQYIEKALSFHLDLDIPTHHKLIRDQIRCMHSLLCNERWSGKYLVRDAVPNCEFGSQISRFDVGTNTSANYTHKSRRPMQEFVVSPSGLVAKLNDKY